MTGEVEAKWWLERPTRPILGLESLMKYDLSQIRAKSPGEPEFHEFHDDFYLKTSSSPIVPRLEGNLFYYGSNYMTVTVEAPKDLVTEVKGFLRLLDLAQPDTPKFAQRLRHDAINGLTYLTVKHKHGQADEDTEEYELLVELREAIGFLTALGFGLRPELSKVKLQERYSFTRGGIDIHAEINTLAHLGGVHFLEIEAVPANHGIVGISFVYQVASEWGIISPERSVFEGGNREDRRYWELQKLYANL